MKNKNKICAKKHLYYHSISRRKRIISFIKLFMRFSNREIFFKVTCPWCNSCVIILESGHCRIFRIFVGRYTIRVVEIKIFLLKRGHELDMTVEMLRNISRTIFMFCSSITSFELFSQRNIDLNYFYIEANKAIVI